MHSAASKHQSPCLPASWLRAHGACASRRPLAAGGTYLPVVVSALPSAAQLFSCPGARVTVDVVSAFAMVTSLALEVSSPQWGQKTIPFSWDTQAVWKRWATRKSG